MTLPNARPRIFLPRSDMYHPDGLDVLEAYGTVSAPMGPISREDWLRGLRETEAVIIVWQTEVIDREALEGARRLRVVARVGVGYENIDVPECTRRGVVVTYCPVHLPTVADLAFGLLLSAARRLRSADRFCRSGDWPKAGPRAAMDFLGTDVHHKLLGIIGLGRIGREIAKRALGFDMEILYTDVVRQEEWEAPLRTRWVSLDTLLQNADFVSVNCPLTDSTRHLISHRQIEMMKPTAILINTARGPIVDLEALYEGLRKGRIAGAGLDVFEEEPLPENHLILHLDNVVLSPHIGAHTREANRNMAVATAEDVIRVLNRRKPKYFLNPSILSVTPLAEG